MDLKILQDIPPWEWPENTAEMLLGILDDDHAEVSDRVLAADLAGDYTVLSDRIAEALLAIVRRGDQTDELRSMAAISLGPALEDGDTFGFDDPDEVAISERVFHAIRQSLRKLFADADVPEGVRRSVLEASVRAPLDWHQHAVRSAYADDDEVWRLTAVFCMRFIGGFDDEIVEALESNHPDIHYQAIRAAGNWGVDAAWPHIAALATAARTDKPLLLAAIDAVAGIRPQEASAVLADLVDSDDEDIVEAAFEALAMAEGLPDDDYVDEEDDDRLLH